MFDVGNSQFLLRCSPDGFGAEPWEEVSSHPGYRSTHVTVTLTNRIMTVETKESREGLAHILRAVQKEYNYLPFSILDYHHPEVADIGTGYTERKVILKKISPVGGTFESSEWGKIGLGWRIEFEEDIRGLL